MVSEEGEGRAREDAFSLACPAYIPFSPAVDDFQHTATALQPLGRFERTTDVHTEVHSSPG